MALERAERELNLHPENSSPAQLGAIALAHFGERDRAREWADRALAIDPDDLIAQYNVACVYAQLGDLEEAMDLLEKVDAAKQCACATVVVKEQLRPRPGPKPSALSKAARDDRERPNIRRLVHGRPTTE